MPNVSIVATCEAHLQKNVERIIVALDRIPNELVWNRLLEGMNSVANLILHLEGNIKYYLGQGITELPYDRNRSEEFNKNEGVSKDRLTEIVHELSTFIKNRLSTVDAEVLSKRANIPEGDSDSKSTRLNMLIHLTEHFSFHTGQIILLSKLLSNNGSRVLEWGH